MVRMNGNYTKNLGCDSQARLVALKPVPVTEIQPTCLLIRRTENRLHIIIWAILQPILQVGVDVLMSLFLQPHSSTLFLGLM